MVQSNVEVIAVRSVSRRTGVLHRSMTRTPSNVMSWTASGASTVGGGSASERAGQSHSRRVPFLVPSGIVSSTVYGPRWRSYDSSWGVGAKSGHRRSVR